VRAPSRRGRGDEWRVRRGRRRQDPPSCPCTPVTLFDVLSRQRRFVYLLVALLSIAGVWAASILPSAIYPELKFARVTIVATGTALGARQQLFSLSRPIEEAVSIVPGVTRVDVLGSDVREIEVVADPVRLAQQEMTFDDLSAAIRDATTVTAVGRMPRDYRQYLMVSATEAHSADDIAAIVVGHGLRVRDLATVTPGTEDRVSIISGNGRPVAQLNITRQLGGNTLAIADSVAGVARALAHTLPPGVRLRPVYHQASPVRDAVTAVRDAMLIGAALAVIVLLLFLR